MTKVDKYKPTKAEEKLLEIMMNPENRRKTVSDICKLADISREIYYRSFRKPEFLNLYREMSFELVKHSVMPVINATVEEAKEGSYNHAKLLLEMADMYNQQTKIDINLNDMSDDEIKELLDDE